jgi:hypothetical protein
MIMSDQEEGQSETQQRIAGCILELTEKLLISGVFLRIWTLVSLRTGVAHFYFGGRQNL